MEVIIILHRIIAVDVIIIITDVVFQTIPVDAFNISIHPIADAVMWHLTRVADATIAIVTMLVVITMIIVAVTMLHRSLTLAETTVADVTETKIKMSEGIALPMPSLL